MSMKRLEENIGIHLCHLRPGNSSFDMTPKTQETKGKILNLDFKLKTFIRQRTQESEKTTDRMGENICKSYI